MGSNPISNGPPALHAPLSFARLRREWAEDSQLGRTSFGYLVDWFDSNTRLPRRVGDKVSQDALHLMGANSDLNYTPAAKYLQIGT